MKLRTQRASEYLGVHPQTLRSYDRRGLIPTYRNQAGQRIFDTNDLDKLKVDLSPTTLVTDDRIIVHYTRASDGSKSLLEAQSVALTNAYGKADKTISDRASGLNEKRKGLNTLLDMVTSNEVKEIRVTTTDRLSRFGVEYIRRILNNHNVTLLVLNEENRTPEEELMRDFMSLIASFSGKFYRLRSTDNKRRLLAAAQKELGDG